MFVASILDLYSKMTIEKNAEQIIIKKKNYFYYKFAWGEECFANFNLPKSHSKIIKFSIVKSKSKSKVLKSILLC